MKPLRLTALLSALLLFAAPAAYAATDGDTLYTMIDQSGQVIAMRGGRMYAGDEYISEENNHYRVQKVDDSAQIAIAEYLGEASVDQSALANFFSLQAAKAEDEAKKNASDEKKLICMYSTHSDESYVPDDGDFSLWENAGIYDVGRALKEELEKRGIEVVYSEESHLPHDADAYNRSRSTAEELLKKGPDALLDIHRDAIPAEQYETEVKGEEISKIRLFVGRSNQNSAANKAFAQEIKRAADEKYPGLIKDIYIGKGNYNQELYPQALLLEMGTDEIEKDKVIDSTKYLAEILDQVLFGSAKAAPAADANGGKPAVAGIAWLIGLAAIAAVVYALASTGGFGEAWNKIKRGASEVTGGLFGKKPRK